MDKKELIKALWNANTAEEIGSIIDKYEADKWISVEDRDRLPEKIGYYLVNVSHEVASKNRGSIEINNCFYSVKQVQGDIVQFIKFDDYVTHWQPLPQPPKTK